MYALDAQAADVRLHGLLAAGLVERAESELRRNAYVALKNIGCEFREGVLTLHGCLPTYYLKQVAQETVARLDGIERIDNRIEVVTTRRS